MAIGHAWIVFTFTGNAGSNPASSALKKVKKTGWIKVGSQPEADPPPAENPVSSAEIRKAPHRGAFLILDLCGIKYAKISEPMELIG